ncbi:MAG: hypothetical protein ACI4TA_09965 [Acetatifactor sp.]
MNEEERKRAIDELKQRLMAGEDIPVETDPPTYVKLDKICDKCRSSVNSIIMGADFVCCPNCGYPIWFNRYLRVPDTSGRLPWYFIEDANGNTVKDYKGDLRLFENEDAAKKYLICCKLEPRRFKILYYGKVYLHVH